MPSPTLTSYTNPGDHTTAESSVGSKIERLLIVRLGAMGDVIHTLPAVAALRAAFPEATLGWLIEERWAELLCTLSTPRSGPRSAQRPLVDRVHTVNTRQWRAAPFSVATWERMAASLSDVRAARYQTAVDFQGAVRSALLARWSGAPILYGATQPRENLASMFYTRQVIPHGQHIVDQNLSLAESVVKRKLEISKAEFPIDDAAQQECDRRLKAAGTQNFALLSPGAGWGAKQWPAERYGEVARQLAENGLKSLVNFGPGEEGLARSVETASGGAAETFTGSLTQLIALTRRARLFIGGDTGPMHLAAALGIPVVAIFGPTDPARNGPFGTRSIVLRSATSNTSYSHVGRPDEGLLEISSGQVIAAGRQLCKEPHG
ncbi:MAG: lipopolysaccharide heptosyltransferase I [Terriglobales bacterium]